MRANVCVTFGSSSTMRIQSVPDEPSVRVSCCGIVTPTVDPDIDCDGRRYTPVRRNALGPLASWRNAGDAVALAGLPNQHRALEHINAASEVADRAFGSKLVQGDRHGMARSANHL